MCVDTMVSKGPKATMVPACVDEVENKDLLC